MALEPITRQEQIIAGKDLEPITRMEKFLKEYGGSGGGGSGVSVQSDWNQPDETAADFIKNKPFYDQRVETVIIEEAEYAPDPDMGFALFSENAIPINAGQVYAVYFDSMIYQCVPVLDPVMGVFIGDINGTAYPFAITSLEGLGTLGLFADGLPHKVKVIAKIGEVEKIDADLIAAEWMAISLENEDILVPLDSYDFSSGAVTFQANRDYSVAEKARNNPLCIKFVVDGVEYKNGNFITGDTREGDREVFAIFPDGDDMDNNSIQIYHDNNDIKVVQPKPATTFSFSIVDTSPVELPSKYLPEIPAEKFVLTSPGGTRFVITVDDSGTLTATEVTA